MDFDDRLTLLFGTLMTGAGLFLAVRTLAFVLRAQRAVGKVVRFASSAGSAERGPVAIPVVRFEVGGSSYTFQALGGGARDRYVVGGPIGVLYDPHNPRHAAVDSFLQIWMFELGLIAIGIVPLGIGLSDLLHLIKGATY